MDEKVTHHILWPMLSILVYLLCYHCGDVFAVAVNILTHSALLTGACSPLAARISPQRVDSQLFAYHASCQLTPPPGSYIPTLP